MSRLIVALDLPAAEQAEAAIDELYDLDLHFKIGLESLFGYPERILSYCEMRDVRCCIDAKLHDIPRTVAAAARSLVHPFVRMITVHASGGNAMMRAAVESVGERSRELDVPPPLVFGVTVLTSMSHDAEVMRLATLARDAGCSGIVCSAREVREVKAFFGDDFLTLTPGIRPAGASAGDQRRTATPAEAVAAGADYLVVGRPILDAPDRRAAAVAVLDEMSVSQMR
jgi:orotidine-5'-phosphate decarboxylase